MSMATRFAPNIIVEVAPESRDSTWEGTPFGNFAQPSRDNARVIEPAPGSLYGNAVGKTMTLETGPTILPKFPPEAEIVERPQYVPGKGWISSANPGN